MDCTQCREVLSARLDGEESASERSLIEAHLTTCGGCRRFADDAAHVTRLARTAVATEPPDLVAAILAAAPRSQARLITTLRVLLGLVGVAQLAVAIAGVFAARIGGSAPEGETHLSGASMEHFAHESAAWNLALGVGFVWVACRSSRTSGVVPTVATFVAVLTGLAVLDLATGWVDPNRLLMHGLVLLGLVLVILLDRRRAPAWGTAPGGTRVARRWLRPVSPQHPADLTPRPDAEGTSGLRPTAGQRSPAVAAQRRTA